MKGSLGREKWVYIGLFSPCQCVMSDRDLLQAGPCVRVWDPGG